MHNRSDRIFRKRKSVRQSVPWPAMTAALLVVVATPKPALAGVNVFFLASPGNGAQGLPQLASTVAWLLAVAAMIAVLVLRLVEPKGRASWSAPLVVRDLEISPGELSLGNSATVAVTAKNRGQHAGTFRVTLKVDGIKVAERDVTLASGMSERVEFSVPGTQSGPMAVNVGGLYGIIVVNKAP